MEGTTIEQIELCFENEVVPESGHLQGNNTPEGDNKKNIKPNVGSGVGRWLYSREATELKVGG